jgi:hypothetical protein
MLTGMSMVEDYESWPRADLIALVRTQQHVIEELRAEVKSLRAELDEVKRSGKRQATPFSKGKRKKNPKKPGRKPGQGLFRYREAPRAEQLSGPPQDVMLEQTLCSCGGLLEPDGIEMAYVTDLPEPRPPLVRAFRVHKARCRRCSKQVRAQHPDLGVEVQGATAHRLSLRLLATGHALHYDVGIPQRKVPRVLKMMGAGDVTHSALNQDALRRARTSVGAAYEQLRAAVRQRSVAYTDDTGWKVGGQGAFLMVFDTDQETVYQVRPQHRNEEVREVLPSTYPGVMVTDRGRSYDAKELASVAQQKCLSHVLRSISEVLESQQGHERHFGERLQKLLREAIALWHLHEKGQVDARQYRLEGHKLQRAVSEHLADRQLQDSAAQRLLDELGWHHDRGNLLRFLQDPRIEPTNNRSEQELRPAVIVRKVSQCSKTWTGARATAVFKSVLRTLRKRGVGAVEGLVALFQGQSLEQIAPAPS